MFIGLGLSLTGLRGGAFSPASLFAAGEPGAWYDFDDLSTLFQDTAGTTPVTAAGQTVARVNDKSGNGINATQGTALQRPTYQVDAGGRGYLSFDGVDDGMVTPTITPGTDKVQVFAGVRKLSDAASAILMETSADSFLNAGSLFVTAPGNAGANSYVFRSRGSALASDAAPSVIAVAPISNVVTGLGDISGDRATLRVDGVQVAQSTADQGAGNYLAYPHYIGRRGGTSLPANMRLYQLIVRFGPNLTDARIAATEAYVAGKTGVEL